MRLAAGIACGMLVTTCIALTAVTRNPWATNEGLTILLMLLMGGIGLLIAGKQPRNAIGWLIIATALLGLLDSAVRLYLVLDYRQHGGALPLGRVAAAYRAGVSIVPFLVALPSILLFPNGRVPSRRWRVALAIYVAVGAVFSLLQFGGAALSSHAHEIKIDIRGNVPTVTPGWVAGFAWLTVPYFLAFWLASVGHQVRTWRRSSGEQRAQLKWLATGAFLCVAGCVALVAFGDGSSAAARGATDLASSRSRRSRSRSASGSCATGCTRSTGWSAARSRTRSSPRRSSDSSSGLSRSRPTCFRSPRPSASPPPRSPPPRSSTHCASACNASSTIASTARATTPRRRSRRSRTACGDRVDAVERREPSRAAHLTVWLRSSP